MRSRKKNSMLVGMDQVQEAYRVLRERVLALRDAETGVWTGELASSALGTALAVTALEAGEAADRALAASGAAWLAAHGLARPLRSVPPIGFIVDGVGCGFLLETLGVELLLEDGVEVVAADEPFFHGGEHLDVVEAVEAVTFGEEVGNLIDELL